MSIWHPYTQHQGMPQPLRVKRAQNATLILEDGRELTDAISSWWCMIHGYNPPKIIEAINQQLSTFPHVMLGGLTHDAAEKAATAIANILPDGLDRVFFSDSGSVAVEVALKMALGFHFNEGRSKKRRFAALKRSYHGDTLGAMGVGDPNDGMHPDYCLGYFDSVFLPAPPPGFKGNSETQSAYFNTVRKQLSPIADEIAGLILEPILQGAGGFHIYSPEILMFFREICNELNICLIADEVATGIFRTGSWIACDHASVVPDIIVLGKGLTGGLIGHAATIATTNIFNSFLSDNPNKAFMHGPTFMGNPLAMAAISASIKLAESNNYAVKVATIQSFLKSELTQIQNHNLVRDVRVLGAMGVIECKSEKTLDGVSEFAIKNGVWLRPIGPYLYTMPAYTLDLSELKKITDVMTRWILSQE